MLRAPRIALLFVLVLWGGCDLADPTGVQSPNIRENEFLELPAIAGVWLNGLERQTSLAYDQFLVPAAIASDSYQNTSNFFVADDALGFINDRNDFVGDAQFALADLREMAVFGLDRVQEEDENVTDEQLAEFHFFRGLSHLLSGMYFRVLPAEPLGAPVPAAEHYRLAIAAADEALALAPDVAAAPSYHMLKARAYFYLGDANQAVAAADAALAALTDVTEVRYVIYDDINLGTQGTGGNPDNDAQDGLFTRTTNDLQPLPRLDFADPKYTDYQKDAAADETDVPMFKAEEAYLIKAQAALAAGNLAEARALMEATVELVAARPKRTIVDEFDPRRIYPEGVDASWTVRFSDDADARTATGLLLARGADAEIAVSEISSTSITADDIAAASSVEEALELVYLMRQEIFLVEGIRMVDLGVKWPVHETEGLLNAAVQLSDREAFVPASLPPPTDWDAFTAFPDERLIVIDVNLNEVLVQNRAAEAVVPFF